MGTLEDRQKLWIWASLSIAAALNLEVGFERWIKGALGMNRVSEEAQCGKPPRRAPLLGSRKIC
jgi:hypothetical protein